jgi:hypothetical protein
MQTRANAGKPFWDLFEKLYATVAKWGKKAKYAMAAYACLGRLLVLAPQEFFHRHNGAFFDLVLDGIGEAETRTACLGIMLQYLKYAGGSR